MGKSLFLIISVLVIPFSIYQNVSAQNRVDTIEEEYTIEWLRNTCCCNELDSTFDCQIKQFGFMDNVDNHNYFYAQYLYERNEDNPDYDSLNEFQNFYGVGIAVFESFDSINVRPIWYYFTDIPAFIDEPLIQMTKYGLIFHPNINTGGNRGLGDDDRYFIRKNDHWYELNNPNYDKIFSSKIPKDHYMDSAGPIDLNNMTYSISVYKPGDAGCCPTGGEITAYLDIQQLDIVVLKVVYKEDSNENK
jgi:hypothetical protein